MDLILNRFQHPALVKVAFSAYIKESECFLEISSF